MQPIDAFATDGTTFVNPLGLVFTILMGILLLVLPRRHALLPVIALICYMTMGMRIMIGPLNFTMLRIVLPFGWLRLILRGELKEIRFNPIDKTILAWVFVSIVTYTLLWQTGDAFKYKLGFAYDCLGFYFMFRYFVRDMDDVIRALRMLAVVIVPLAGAMILEKMTGRNPFALFGGVPEVTSVREGALRCQGPFAHPILAGTFGATLLALFVGLYRQGAKRFWPAVAVISSLVIVVTSASSGPLFAAVLGIGALALWRWRNQMRTLRYGILGALVSLHLVMRAPVWFLLARVDIVQGSTGYHRAYLIDRAIANFWDWWLVGTKSTWKWADRDAHLFDVTNAYIQNGASGGLITMALFIAIIALSFKAVGRSVRLGETSLPIANRKLTWALGAALFAHAVTYISVTYFDQNFVNWYLLLAMISSVAGPSLLMTRQEFLEKVRTQPAADSSDGQISVPARPWARVAPRPRPKLQAGPGLTLKGTLRERL
jgi:hypothetical protein